MLEKEEILYKTKNLINYTEKSIDIALCSDENYIPYLGISILSIIKKNPNKNIHFHLFITGIKEQDISKINSIQNKNINISIYFLNESLFKNLPKIGHFSHAIYYRLVIPIVLSHLDNVLYIDTDIICLNDISSLFKIDLTEHVIAVVEDHLIQDNYLSNLGFSRNDGYFNSGVILINIPLWNKLNIFEKFINQMAKNGMNYAYPDQDALNFILKNDKKLIEKKYNWIEWHNENYGNPIFLHFIGETKPWHEIGHNTDFEKIKDNSPWSYLTKLTPKNTRLYGKYSRFFWRNGNLIKAMKYQLIYLYRKLFKIK